MTYRLEQIKYGLAGIAVTVIVVDVSLLLLHFLRIGQQGGSALLAVGWVSFMTALLVVGAAAIVFSEGKLLELFIPLQVNKLLGGMIVLAGAFIVSVIAIRIQNRSTWLDRLWGEVCLAPFNVIRRRAGARETSWPFRARPAG